MKSRQLKIWWEAEETEIHEAIFAVVRQLESNASGRESLYTMNATYYMDREFTGLRPEDAAETPWACMSDAQVAYNITKSAIDTLTSKVGKAKPRVFFLSDDGNFDLKQRAKGLNQYIAGIFEDQKMYAQGKEVFRDACIYGSGVVKVFYDSNKRTIQLERTEIRDIIADEYEGAKPKQIHQRAFLDRYTLVKLFPEKETEIMFGSTQSNQDSDRVEVIESWYVGLPGVPGKHTICTPQACLLNEVWEGSLPFVFFHYDRPLNGFYGGSLASALRGIQKTNNRTLEVIQESLDAVARPKFFYKKGDRFYNAAGEITNEVGEVCFYDETPPVVRTATAQNPEMYQFLETSHRKGYEIIGVSQMSAMAKNLPGVESAVAMQQMSDVEQDRFADISQRYQDFYLEVADKIIERSKIHFSKKTKVSQKSDQLYTQAFWGDIDMDRDMFQLSAFGTNILPETPAGKLQSISDLAKAGIIPPERVLELLDFPDLKNEIAFETATRRLAEKVCNNIITKGIYYAPDKMDPLEDFAKVATITRVQAKIADDTDPSNLALLEQFIEAIADLTAPPEPPMPEGEPAPMDPGMAPPPPMDPMMDPGMAPALPSQ